MAAAKETQGASMVVERVCVDQLSSRGRQEDRHPLVGFHTGMMTGIIWRPFLR